MDGLRDAKWVQIGTVMDNPVEGFKGRLPNKLRKRTLTQQWMSDPEMGHTLHKRFSHITVHYAHPPPHTHSFRRTRIRKLRI